MCKWSINSSDTAPSSSTVPAYTSASTTPVTTGSASTMPNSIFKPGDLMYALPSNMKISDEDRKSYSLGITNAVIKGSDSDGDEKLTANDTCWKALANPEKRTDPKTKPEHTSPDNKCNKKSSCPKNRHHKPCDKNKDKNVKTMNDNYISPSLLTDGKPDPQKIFNIFNTNNDDQIDANEMQATFRLHDLASLFSVSKIRGNANDGILTSEERDAGIKFALANPEITKLFLNILSAT